MRILGIDPGLATLGYGVIDTAGSRVTLVKAGAIITTPDMIEPDRLVSIRQQMNQLLQLYRPDEIAFEERIRRPRSDGVHLRRIHARAV